MLPELISDRLIMREVQLADAPELQDYETRPDFHRFQAVEPEEFTDGNLRIKRYFENRGEGNNRRIFVFVARSKDSGDLIGQFGISLYHPELASLGFGIANKNWGQGYGTELAKKALSYGFKELALHRISADVAVDHLACRQLVENIGMELEGVARDSIWAQGRWWTEAKYAILKSDIAADVF